MATLTIDSRLRTEFWRLWREYADGQTAAVGGTGGLVIFQDPFEQGPNQNGHIVFREVSEAFLEEVRANNFTILKVEE